MYGVWNVIDCMECGDMDVVPDGSVVIDVIECGDRCIVFGDRYMECRD